MLRPMLAAGVILASLAACQAEGGPNDSVEPGATEPADEATEIAAVSTPTQTPTSTDEQANPSSIDTEAEDSDCGADKLGRWLNVLPTEPIKADIAEMVGERPIRYYTQGDPITMDFSPARLNVELGVDGRIKVFRCG